MTSLQSTGGVSFRSVANPKCCTHSVSYQHWWWLSQHSWPETMRLLGQNYRKERENLKWASNGPPGTFCGNINNQHAWGLSSGPSIAVLFQIEFYSSVLHCQYLTQIYLLHSIRNHWKAETSTPHAPFIPSSTANQANSSICIYFSETQLKTILLLHFHIKLFHID